MRDGVRLAGGSIGHGDLVPVFYGDLFRPHGVRSWDMPDYDISDLTDPFEQDLLHAWWTTTTEYDSTFPGQGVARARTPRWIQRAIYGLCGSKYFSGLTERALIGSIKQVRIYFTDQEIRRRIRARFLAAISSDTKVVVGHSLGSVVAYEGICARANVSAMTMITLGPPIGLPNLIFDRLEPTPTKGQGQWPGRIQHWTNIADHGDMVANPKALAPLFGARVADIIIYNGAKAHDIRPYLTARETGEAIFAGINT